MGIDDFGIFTTRQLRSRGISSRSLTRAVNEHRLVRVRRGVYATAEASPELIDAARIGGRVTCITALRLHGAWTMPEPQIHVRVARGVDVPRTTARLHFGDSDSCEHRIDTVADAVALAIRCLDQRSAIVAMDSVLNLGLMTFVEMEIACSRSARGRRLFAQVDPSSESGLETLARLALRRRRVRLRTQVQIDEDTRVDILIGDRLILELDGRAWHDRPGDFERDRARDRRLAAAGYIVLRASYTQVMHEWPTIEQQILVLVRRREHLWRAGQRRV